MINTLKEKYKNMAKPAKASLWFLFCSFLQKGISVITTPIFTRLLDTAEYGRYNVFSSWMSIVSIIVTLELFAGVYTQGLVKFEEERDSFASSLQGLTLTLVSFFTVVYLIFREWLNPLFSLTTVQMLAMLLLIWTTSVFTFWASAERVKYEYKHLVLLTAAVSVLKPALEIFLVVNSEDRVTARILGLATVELLAFSWLFFLQMKRGKKFFSAKYWKYAVCFNLPLIPHYLSQILLNNSDRLMIKSMVSESAAGIYSLAYGLAQLMILFNTALLQTLEPWIYRKIKARELDDIPRVAYPSLAAIGILNLLLIVFAPEIVSIFAPSEYYEAIWVIPPVAMSGFFLFSYCFFADFEFYFERRSFIMAASVGGAVLNLILNYIFIGIYGYFAAGYTTLVCYILYALGHYLFMQRICKTELHGERVYSPKVLLFLSLGFLAAGFGIMATYTLPVIRYSVVVLSLVLAVIFRRRIFAFVTTFLSLRKKSDGRT